MSAKETRNIDLGPPVDPRDEWPVLRPFTEYPVAWEIMSDGEPREVRVVGWLGQVVLIARESKERSDKAEHLRWWTVSVPLEDVFTDLHTARLHGLAHLQLKLTDIGKGLEKIAEAAGVVLAKKKLPQRA